MITFEEVCKAVKERDAVYCEGYRDALLELSTALKTVDPVLLLAIAPSIKHVQSCYARLVRGGRNAQAC